MNFLKSLFSGTLFAIAFVLSTVFMLEIGARLWLSHFASESNFRKYASYRELVTRYGGPIFSRHRYLGYYPTPGFIDHKNKNRHNSLGYRGDEIQQPKPDHAKRIVCIGGSTTYTIFTSYQNSYPYLLQANLSEIGYEDVTVVNAGVPGWTTWESLVNFQFRVLDLDPDVIIINHGINDGFSRLVWPSNWFRGDNSGYRVATTEPSPLLNYSALFRIISVRFGLTPPVTSLDFLDTHAASHLGAELSRQMWRNSFPSGIFSRVSPHTMLKENDLRYFRRNIENLISIAQARQIRVILATFAYTTEFKDPIGGINDVTYATIQQANAALRELAAQNSVSLFDFSDVFPTDKKYFSDWHHVNEQGSRLKSKLFANYIHEADLIR